MTTQLKILVVDDDNVIRTILMRFLARDCAVHGACDGQEALSILERNDPHIDLVLCDIEMPKLDGLQVLRTVRSQYPQTGMIMISGSADTRTAVQAIRDGAYDYITKPFHDIEEVAFTIQRWKKQQSLETKLNQYASLHREMMKNMKTRTFLAVDVSGSKELKFGEDPFIVQYSFKAYQDFIEARTKAFGGLIHSTSGDGAMACFETATDAISAAQSILAELPQFNLEANQLKKEFRLRLGLHTGKALLGSDGKISEMFAETLDIAGHLQKEAEENNILISDETVRSVNKPGFFKPAQMEIDGIRTFHLQNQVSEIQYSVS